MALFAGIAWTLVVVLVAGAVYLHTEQRPFTSSDWRGDRSPFRVRRSMMESLLRDHLKLGATRADVERMLGPAESPSWNGALPYPGWEVAGASGVGSDSGALLVRYDAAARLTGYWSQFGSAGSSLQQAEGE